MFKRKEEVLKICTLSGTNEVGRNCNFVEYGNDILVVDCGFSFPGEEMYGIDYLLPNTKYLSSKKRNIKGILITHGHLDHIGALAYILPDLGFPTVYAGEFARAIIEEKLKEANLIKKVKIVTVKHNIDIKLGVFNIRFLEVSHSIPDSSSIFIQSPRGNVFFSGDYKIDEKSDLSKIESLKGKVDIALLESTYAGKPGKAKSEADVAVNLEKVIAQHKGRVIVAAFASLVSRLSSLIEIAKRNGKKVVISGRSLHTILRIAVDQRYINIPDNLIISEKEMNKYEDSKLMIITTGSQAERYAALNRIALGEHAGIKGKKGDLILMSSSEIPGNAGKIERMTDGLISLGVDLLKNGEEEIHASGHGMQEDMKQFYNLLKPKYVIPVHGSLTMRYFSKKNYVEWGHNSDHVLLTADGQMWEYENSFCRKTTNIESRPILVDGLGTRDTGDIVLRDRKQLAEFGFLTIVLNLHSVTGNLIGNPRFVSRGFIYMKTGGALLKEIENIVSDVHREWKKKHRKEKAELVEEIEKRVGRYVYKKTEREPIILTAII